MTPDQMNQLIHSVRRDKDGKSLCWHVEKKKIEYLGVSEWEVYKRVSYKCGKCGCEFNPNPNYLTDGAAYLAAYGKGILGENKYDRN